MAKQLKRILYLEDDEHISEIAQLSLGLNPELEVRHCERGADAIAKFSDFRPDLLLFDVMLPDMDGVETLAEIRKLPGGENTPVIFMTAKAQTHEQSQYLGNGALSVIVKPFDAFNLPNQLNDIWEKNDAPARQN